MSPKTTAPTRPSPKHYLNQGYGWKSWLLTQDHKRIAILYLISLHHGLLLRGRPSRC